MCFTRDTVAPCSYITYALSRGKRLRTTLLKPYGIVQIEEDVHDVLAPAGETFINSLFSIRIVIVYRIFQIKVMRIYLLESRKKNQWMGGGGGDHQQINNTN